MNVGLEYQWFSRKRGCIGRRFQEEVSLYRVDKTQKHACQIADLESARGVARNAAAAAAV